LELLCSRGRSISRGPRFWRKKKPPTGAGHFVRHPPGGGGGRVQGRFLAEVGSDPKTERLCLKKTVRGGGGGGPKKGGPFSVGPGGAFLSGGNLLFTQVSACFKVLCCGLLGEKRDPARGAELHRHIRPPRGPGGGSSFFSAVCVCRFLGPLFPPGHFSGRFFRLFLTSRPQSGGPPPAFNKSRLRYWPREKIQVVSFFSIPRCFLPRSGFQGARRFRLGGGGHRAARRGP